MLMACPFLERHAEIALPSIAQHGDHDLLGGERFGDAARCPHVGAGGDAHEQSFLAGEAARGGRGVLVAYLHHLVHHGAVEHTGHEGGADALDAVRARPPESTGDRVGSTPITRTPGSRSRSTSPTPVIVPPVPTPATKTSTRSSVASRISSAVVRRCASGFAGFSNCCGMK